MALSVWEVSLGLTQNKGAAPEVSAPQNPPSTPPASVGWWSLDRALAPSVPTGCPAGLPHGFGVFLCLQAVALEPLKPAQLKAAVLPFLPSQGHGAGQQCCVKPAFSLPLEAVSPQNPPGPRPSVATLVGKEGSLAREWNYFCLLCEEAPVSVSLDIDVPSVSHHPLAIPRPAACYF